MKKAWVLSYPLSAQRRLWSVWVDAQADLSLRWAHSHIVGFVMSRLKCFVISTGQHCLFRFFMLVFKLFPSDCCQRRVYSSEVKLRTENFCRWVISVKREGFSSWTYELRGSNTAHVSKGKLLPISGVGIYFKDIF